MSQQALVVPHVAALVVCEVWGWGCEVWGCEGGKVRDVGVEGCEVRGRVGVGG